MRIVVLGAGTVGTSVAEMLCQHRHSVTVVDHDPAVTRRVNDELDVRAITGSVARSSVLFQAEMLGADLCLALTSSDESNMLAASIAKAMGARRAMARIYSPVFRDVSTFDYQGHFQIDRLLSLEHLSAMELARRIREPGSIAVENLARGDLEMQEMAIIAKTSAVGTVLRDLKLPSEVRIGSINRDGKVTIARADDTIMLGDRVTLIGSREDIDDVKELFEIEPPQKQGVVIAGGGRNRIPTRQGPRRTTFRRGFDGSRSQTLRVPGLALEARHGRQLRRPAEDQSGRRAGGKCRRVRGRHRRRREQHHGMRRGPRIGGQDDCLDRGPAGLRQRGR